MSPTRGLGGNIKPEVKQRICAAGGKAAHAQGVAHEWTSTEAQAAGRKGGQQSALRKRIKRLLALLPEKTS